MPVQRRLHYEALEFGKTQVAVEFANSRKDNFDAVFWIQADETSKLAESFTQIASALKLTDPADAGDYVISRSVVMEWLSAPSRASQGNVQDEVESSDPDITWLLMFDNADNLEILRGSWPVGGTHHCILVTSRDPLAKSYHYKSSGVDLESFSSKEAATLLQRLTAQHKNQDSEVSSDSLQLSERLGGLPPAITQAAAVIRRRELTFKEMLTMYEEDIKIADSEPSKLTSHEDQYSRSLSTVWAVQELSQAAKDLSDVISPLDSDCIQETILTSKFTSSKLRNFSSTCSSCTEARTDLWKSSLVRRNKEQNHLMIHRLIQDFARARMTAERSQAVFEFVVELLIAA